MATTHPRWASARPILALVLLASAGSASAHEFWLQPSSHWTQPGSMVDVRILIGPPSAAEPFPLRPDHALRFALVGPEGDAPVTGRSGDEPAGRVRAAMPGTSVIAYSSSQTRAELPPDQFRQYLVEDGLDAVIAERERRGEAEAPGRELFSRCAKALVVVAAPDAGGHSRRAGLELELIPEAAPWLVASGSDLPIRVLHRGSPLAHTLVRAMRTDVDQPAVTGRSDAEGLVHLPVHAPGQWLINTVHAVRLPVDVAAELEADWASVWSSLTFEIPPR